MRKGLRAGSALMLPGSDEQEATALFGRPAHLGPFTVDRTPDRLTLRQDDQGGFDLKGCLLLAFTMLFVTILGVMSVVHTADVDERIATDDPARLFAPSLNHVGFLWLVALGLLCIVVPWYVRNAYRSAHTYTFDPLKDAFLHNDRKQFALHRLEYVRIRETRDPDAAYLYLLELVHTDGYDFPLFNGYDERAVLNLANEITSFTGVPLQFK
mgnify:CR=1 FL=1|jgi:hypothetical protein